MNVEEAREIAKQKIEQLAAELGRGESETVKAYLAAMAKLPRYSLHNLLLIMAQHPGAQQCAGLKTWNRLGRYVLPGQRGIAILAPITPRHQRRGTASAGREDVSESELRDSEEIVTSFRRVYIFSVDQTAGAPLPEPACVDGDPGIYFERLTQAIAEHGIKLTYSQAIGAAHGVSTRDRIILRSDLAPAERFSTAVHELAHIRLGHHTPDDPATTATLHETEAEAVAYVVCQAIGLTTGTASSDYLHVWGGDARLLAASLERIQRVASEIITAIGPDV